MKWFTLSNFLICSQNGGDHSGLCLCPWSFITTRRHVNSELINHERIQRNSDRCSRTGQNFEITNSNLCKYGNIIIKTLLVFRNMQKNFRFPQLHERDGSNRSTGNQNEKYSLNLTVKYMTAIHILAGIQIPRYT